MKKIYLLYVVIALLLVSSFVSAEGIKQDLSDIISETPADENISVIINFKDRPTPADISVIKSDGANIKNRYNIINAIAAQVPAQAVDKISKRASVDFVEPDYKVKLVLDNSVSQIQTDNVWETGVTGEDVDVAIIDTGIHDEHPALDVVNEIDYTGEGTDDLHGHGTHIAGIIASNDSTYKGVAYNSNLFNIKVLNEEGSGYGSDVINGIEWAMDNGVEVISISLGAEIDPCDGTDAISKAVDKAVNQGVVVIVAAGNAGPDSETITTPGCSKSGITIGAVDDDSVPSFSSKGPTDDGRIKPDLVAPGVSITSTWKDNSFKSLSGTSMSTPHVSGVVALLLEANTDLKPSDIKETLKSTALDLGLDENTQGAGRVDAYEAFLEVFENVINLEVETKEASKITNDSVQLNGELINIDKDSDVFVFFRWREIENWVETIPEKINETGMFSKRIDGLKPETEYEFKAVVQWDENESVGEDMTFTTETSSEEDKEDDFLGWEKRRENLEARGRKPQGVGYGLTRAWERVRLAFAFNENSRARLHFDFADKRLSEAVLISEEDEEKTKELLEEYEKNLEKGNEISKSAQQAGKNFSDINGVVARGTVVHEEVLRDVLKKVPEQAKPAIQRAINNSQRVNKEILDTFEKSRPEKVAEIHFAIAERNLNRVRERAEEGEFDNVDELIREYGERVNKSNKAMEKAKGIGNNTTGVEKIVTKSSSAHLEILSEVYEKVPEQSRQNIERAMGVSSNGREKAVKSLKEKDSLNNIPEDVPVSNEVRDKMPSISNGSSSQGNRDNNPTSQGGNNPTSQSGNNPTSQGGNNPASGITNSASSNLENPKNE